MERYSPNIKTRSIDDQTTDLQKNNYDYWNDKTDCCLQWSISTNNLRHGNANNTEDSTEAHVDS